MEFFRIALHFVILAVHLFHQLWSSLADCKKLLVIAHEDKGCPEVRMGEGAGGRLARDIGPCTGAGYAFGFLSGEFAGDEFLLGLLERLGFGELSGGEVGVELLHEEGGAGVVHGPERGEDGFSSATEEVAADAGDFGAVLARSAQSCLAGAEDDEVGGVEII
jgi:hypothetical protein